jgi:hypothetical protein
VPPVLVIHEERRNFALDSDRAKGPGMVCIRRLSEAYAQMLAVAAGLS